MGCQLKECTIVRLNCSYKKLVHISEKLYGQMSGCLTRPLNLLLSKYEGMGSLLLAAGTPGLRHSLPHSRIMIHQPSGGVSVKYIYLIYILFFPKESFY